MPPPGRRPKRAAPAAAAALRELESIRQQVKFLEAQKSTLAQGAVRDGATWEAVGEALGLARATAYKRYGPGSWPEDRV